MTYQPISRVRRLLLKAPGSLLALSTITAAVRPTAGYAQTPKDYPEHPIRFVVPYPPGGVTDRVARMLGEKLQASMGQSIIVDNRGGAGATLGSDFVAKAKPDGYTVLMGVNASHSVNVSLMKLPYDPITSFTPISLMVTTPNMLMVNAASSIKTFHEFIEKAKAAPGTLTYTSAGVGTVGHLGMELLSKMAGLKLVHVPASGPAQAVNDVAAGHIDCFIDTPALSLPLVKAGRLRALAVTSLERSPAVPQLPTISESGYPGFEVILWFALFAPANTPQAIVERLNEEVGKALKDPSISQPLVADGLTIVASSPARLAEFQRSEIEKYANLIKSAHIKTS